MTVATDVTYIADFGQIVLNQQSVNTVYLAILMSNMKQW